MAADSAEKLLASDQELYAMIAQGDRLLQQMIAKRERGELSAFQRLKVVSFEQDLFEAKERLMRRQSDMRDRAGIEDKSMFGLDSLSDFSSGLKTKLIGLFHWGADKAGLAGMGVLPLLLVPLVIKASVAIIAAISAVAIVDMLTDSTEEKADLMETANKLGQELGMSSAEIQALIADTMPDKSGSGLFGNMFSGITGVALGALLVWQGPKLLKKLT